MMAQIIKVVLAHTCVHGFDPREVLLHAGDSVLVHHTVTTERRSPVKAARCEVDHDPTVGTDPCADEAVLGWVHGTEGAVHTCHT